MTNTELKTLIDANGGIDYVIGMRFKNGYKLAFSKEAMREDEMVTIGGVDFIKFDHYDTNNRKIVSYLLSDEIAQVYFLTSLTENVNLRETME